MLLTMSVSCVLLLCLLDSSPLLGSAGISIPYPYLPALKIIQ